MITNIRGKYPQKEDLYMNVRNRIAQKFTEYVLNIILFLTEFPAEGNRKIGSKQDAIIFVHKDKNLTFSPLSNKNIHKSRDNYWQFKNQCSFNEAFKVINLLFLMGNCCINPTSEEQSIKTGKVLDLKIVNCIWQQDYQKGLFDFQAMAIQHKLFTFNSNSIFINQTERKSVSSITDNLQHLKNLATSSFAVHRRPNYYKISPIIPLNEKDCSERCMWLVVKSLPNRNYHLKQKDIIKLGKEIIQIRQIVTKQIHPSTDSHFGIFEKCTEKIDKLKDSAISKLSDQNCQPEDYASLSRTQSNINQKTCRVCLEEAQLNNPLISPCKCSGSVKYIHIQCFREWQASKLNIIKTKFGLTVKYIRPSCEMCKSLINQTLQFGNKKYETLRLPNLPTPYLILEPMNQKAKNTKILHIVSFAQSERMSLGRNRVSDINISDDISVESYHANIIYDSQKGHFLLQDNRSRFGTLVQVKNNLIVNPSQSGITFQLDGELYVLSTQRGQQQFSDYYEEQEYQDLAEDGEVENNSQQIVTNNQTQKSILLANIAVKSLFTLLSQKTK